MVQNPKYWRTKECARIQNKTQLTRKVCSHFPVESCHILLLSNILDFVPCDLQLQRAYYLQEKKILVFKCKLSARTLALFTLL